MFIVQAINLIFNQYTNWLQTKQNYRIIRANGIICLAKKIFNSEGFLFVADNNHLTHLNFVKTEVGSQEVRGRKLEVRSRKSGSQRSEVGRQKTEDLRREMELFFSPSGGDTEGVDGRQKLEDGRP